MNKRSMGKFGTGLALALLAGCQDIAISSTGSKGSVRFRFEMPKASFQLQAIPAGTNRFEVEISGEGMTTPRKETITQADGTTKTISELPTGTKQVLVKALKDTELLASGSTSVTIVAGQVARAEVTLAEATRSRSVVIALEQSLPIDLAFNVTFTGAGLDTPLTKEATLKAGETEVALGELPLGDKEANLTMTAIAGAKRVSVTPESRSFAVTEEGARIDIAAGSVLRHFSNDLESLLSQADSLRVLAWLQDLRSRPARLREYFFMLPLGARQRLRQNPLVSSFLPPESEASSSPPARAGG